MPLDIPAGIGTRLQRLIDHPSRERIAAGLLAAGVVAYACVALILTRGAVPIGDELSYFAHGGDLSPSSLLEPYNGHLIALTRFFWAVDLNVFGAEELPIRLLVIAGVALSAILAFLLIRKRVGGLVAVWPALLIMFCGATPVALQGFVMMFAQATALGLAGFLLLDRDSRRSDLAACLALVLAVLSFEVGVAFAVGAALLILLGPGRSGRIWVAVVPLAVYAAWYVWALKFDQSEGDLFNLLLFPVYAANAFAAGAAALSGLAVNFTDSPSSAVIEIGWGRLVAVGIGALCVFRAMRIGVSRLQLAVVAVLIVLWAGGAVNFGPLRAPEAARYAFPVVVLLPILLAEGFRRSRTTPLGLTLVVVLTIAAMAPNLFLLRQQGAEVRARAAETEIRLAILRLEEAYVDPNLNLGLGLPVRAGDYLRSADEFGGFEVAPSSLSREPAGARAVADEMLNSVVTPGFAEPPAEHGRCTSVTGEALAGGFELPPGGALLEAQQASEVKLRRFGNEFRTDLGTLPADEPRALAVPVDSSPTPWSVSAPTAGSMRLCPLQPAGVSE